MIKVTVKINGREYNLKGNDNEEYLKNVSSFVDGKIKQIKANNGVLSSVEQVFLQLLILQMSYIEQILKLMNFQVEIKL